MKIFNNLVLFTAMLATSQLSFAGDSRCQTVLKATDCQKESCHAIVTNVKPVGKGKKDFDVILSVDLGATKQNCLFKFGDVPMRQGFRVDVFTKKTTVNGYLSTVLVGHDANSGKGKKKKPPTWWIARP